MPGVLHLLDDREVGRLAESDAAAQFLAAALQQRVEGTALPGLRSLTLVAAAVVDHCRLVRGIGPPAEDEAFVDRMQRVDEHEGAGNHEACRVAALAEVADQAAFLRAFEAAAYEPAEQGIQGGGSHGLAPINPRGL